MPIETTQTFRPGAATLAVTTENVSRTKKRLAALLDTLRAQGWEAGRAASWSEELTQSNYKLLCETNLYDKSLPLAAVAVELLAAHQPDTVRGNMYLVVSAGFLPDTGDKSYDRVQRLLNRLRENGTIRFEWIVDTVRQTIKPNSWSGLQTFADAVRRLYRMDYWERLPEYVEIIVEKDTIAGKLASVTREYDVPLHPIRGYSSTSYAYRIAQNWKRIKKPIFVYYIGDHDPSGRDLERDIHERLKRYSGRQFSWVRLGVNPEHFSPYNIIPWNPKKKDSRYKRFAEAWGDRCAEVEAIPATALRQMVRSAIESHIPAGTWGALKRVEELEREQFASILQPLRGNTVA